jgi:hypothetical protein
MDPLARASIALASAAEARQRALDAASYRTRIETVIAHEEDEYLILQSALHDESLSLQDAVDSQVTAENAARTSKLKLLQLMRGASLILTTIHPEWAGAGSITALQNPSPLYSWERIDDPALPSGVSRLLDVTCAAEAAAAADRRTRTLVQAEASEAEAFAERQMLYRLNVGDLTSLSPKKNGNQREKLSPPKRIPVSLPPPPPEPELSDICDDFEKLLARITFFVRRSPLLRSAALAAQQ